MNDGAKHVVGSSLSRLPYPLKLHPYVSREEALTDPAIRKPLVFLSEFRFCLLDIPLEIAVRLYRPVHPSKIVVRRSHDISVSGINGQQAAICKMIHGRVKFFMQRSTNFFAFTMRPAHKV
jgi:hypothetical protein